MLTRRLLGSLLVLLLGVPQFSFAALPPVSGPATAPAAPSAATDPKADGKSACGSQTTTAGQPSAPKEVSGKNVGEVIQQLDPSTHDTVIIGPDGKVQVQSRCGEAGKPGSVRMCLMSGICVNVPKDEALNSKIAELQSDPTFKQALSSTNPEETARMLTKKLFEAKPGLQKQLSGAMKSVLDQAFGEGGGIFTMKGQVKGEVQKSADQIINALAQGDFAEVARSSQVLGKKLKESGVLEELTNPSKWGGLFERVSGGQLSPQGKEAFGVLASVACDLTGQNCPGVTSAVGTTGFTPQTLVDRATGALEQAAGTLSSETTSFVDSLKGIGCRGSELSCRTNNPGAMTYASWMSKYGGSACGETNNTACFPSVENGLAAKADLILRRIDSGCSTLYSILENCRYASSRDGNDSATYARVVGNKTGLGAHTTLDRNNAEQMAKLISGIAWYEQGQKGYGFDAEQLKKALSVAYGSASPDSLPKGTPGFTSGTKAASLLDAAKNGNFSTLLPTTGSLGSMLNSLFGMGSGSASGTSGSSPLSGLLGRLSGLFKGFGSGGSGGASGSGGNSAGSGATSAQPGQSNSGGAPGNTNTAGTPTAGTASTATERPLATPAVTLISNKREVAHGETYSIIWAATGVSESAACRLYEESSAGARRQVAVGNSDSITRDAPALGVGPLRFTLECTPSDSRVPASDARKVLEVGIAL